MPAEQREPFLAQQALQVLDTQGEAPMLAFLSQNQDHPPEQKPVAPPLAVLTDGTTVEQAAAEYTFTWPDPTKAQQTARETRNSQLPTLVSPVPLVDFDSVSFYQKVMQHILYETACTTDMHPTENTPHEALAYNAAPDLNQTIRNVLLTHDISDHLWSALDAEADHCADKVLESLPLDHKEELRKLALRFIQAAA